jgi:transposase InsO family protein
VCRELGLKAKRTRRKRLERSPAAAAYTDGSEPGVVDQFRQRCDRRRPATVRVLSLIDSFTRRSLALEVTPASPAGV